MANPAIKRISAPIGARGRRLRKRFSGKRALLGDEK